jgi:hypothetical protein
MRASSVVEPRSRGRPASSEAGPRPRGATDPRARQNLARGGDRPPSETEPHPRGRPALERGGGLPVRCRAPRAKRSSARGWLGRLSSGSLGPPGPWAREFALRVFWVCLRFFFVSCEGKWVFPGCLGNPFGCPRQCQCSLYGHQSSSSLTNEAY